MSRLTIRQLEIFSTAAKLLSFTKTAKTLHMSKPAVSKQIKNLEDYFKMPLFEQIGKKIFLTNTAKAILPQINSIESEIQKLDDLINIHRTPSREVITLSLGYAYSNIIFPILKQYSSKYNVHFDINLHHPQQLICTIKDNIVDVLISGIPIHDKNLQNSQFLDINYMLIASTDNSLTEMNKITPELLANETFILLSDSNELQLQLEKNLSSININESNILRLNSYPAMKEAIKSGFGIGMLPTSLIQDDLKLRSLTILPYTKFNFTNPIYAVSHTLNKHSKPINQFINFLTTESKLTI